RQRFRRRATLAERVRNITTSRVQRCDRWSNVNLQACCEVRSSRRKRDQTADVCSSGPRPASGSTSALYIASSVKHVSIVIKVIEVAIVTSGVTGEAET